MNRILRIVKDNSLCFSIILNLPFSERITLQWWHYAVPVGLLLLIMLATIASVVWKAARTNPVESLRYE